MINNHSIDENQITLKYKQLIRSIFRSFMKSIRLFIFCLVLLSTNLFAATTGKLAGKVRDIDGKPIQFANIIIENQDIGIRSDEKGKYYLKNIEPGKHSVVYSKLGYQSKKIIKIKIEAGETTVQNIQLARTALEVPGITVSEARNKLVDKLKTSSGKVITNDLIEEVSFTEVSDLIALQAGAFVNNGELHIRGGRMNEVVYVVDGICVTDVVDGESTLAIDVDAIKEIKVMTGGFPAEYGNAQSGIINIITKSGSSEYHGKLKASGDWIEDSTQSDMISANLSGPLIPMGDLKKKLSFFLSYKLKRSNTYLFDEFGANAYEDITTIIYGAQMPYWQDYDFYDPDFGGSFSDIFSKKRVENDQFLNLKLDYKISNSDKIDFAFRSSEFYATPYNNVWKYALEHYKEIRLHQEQAIINYIKTFGSQLTWDTKFGYYSKRYQENPRNLKVGDLYLKDPESFDLYADNFSGNSTGISYPNQSNVLDGLDQYWYYTVIGANYSLGLYKSPGSFYTKFIENKNESYTFKTDLDYQYNHVHNIKSGIEIIQHQIDRDKYVNPSVHDMYMFNYYLSQQTAVDSVQHEFLDTYIYLYSLDDIFDATLYAAGQYFGVKAKTTQFNYYIQDKMEWEGLVVNAGFRLDGWYLGKDYQQQSYDRSWLTNQIAKKHRLHLMISPRIGISHAISEKSVWHIGFNYQNQLPQLKNVYPDATSYAMQVGAQDWQAVVIGNPAIEPQKSIAGEVGLQHQFSTNFFIDGTIYYKQNFNYPSIEKSYTDEQGFLYEYRYVTNNYGTVKGLDLNLEKTLSSFTSASIAYSLSWAEGTDSEYYDFEPDYEVPNQEFPLDWDSRHNLGVNLNFKIQAEEDLYLPFTDLVIPLHDFFINYTYNYASGVPILGSIDSNAGIQRMEDTRLANLKITKGFNIYKNIRTKIFMHISNLFDYENIVFAYVTTGSPFEDGEVFDDENEQYLHDMQTNNPRNIGSSREIILGLSLEW